MLISFFITIVYTNVICSEALFVIVQEDLTVISVYYYFHVINVCS